MPSAKVKKQIDKKIKEVKNFGDEVVKKLKEVKERYDHLDAETKKKIVTGASSVLALLVGAAMVKKMFKKRKK